MLGKPPGPEPGSLILEHGSLILEHGSLILEHGSLTLEHGSLKLEHGSLTLKHGVRNSSVQQQYVVYGANRSCYCTCPMLAHKFIIAPVVVVEMVKWRGHSTRVAYIAGEHSINVFPC